MSPVKNRSGQSVSLITHTRSRFEKLKLERLLISDNLRIRVNWLEDVISYLVVFLNSSIKFRNIIYTF